MPDNVRWRRLPDQCNRNKPPWLAMVRVERQCKRLPPSLVTGRAHVNSIRSKTEQKAIRRPVVLSGRSLEPFGNGRPRQMITQRHNPAYRSACVFKNRIVSYNMIFNLRRFSSAGFSQFFYFIGKTACGALLCGRKFHRNFCYKKVEAVFSFHNKISILL